MTPKQKNIIDFIRDYPHQYPLTIREIGAGVGLSSSSTVHHHIKKLVEMGLLECRTNCSRCIVLTERCL